MIYRIVGSTSQTNNLRAADCRVSKDKEKAESTSKCQASDNLMLSECFLGALRNNRPDSQQEFTPGSAKNKFPTRLFRNILFASMQ